MSKADVEAVFGPQWVQDALVYHRELERGYAKALLALRRKLRNQDPTLPNEYDGPGWRPIEQEWER